VEKKKVVCLMRLRRDDGIKPARELREQICPQKLSAKSDPSTVQVALKSDRSFVQPWNANNPE
jgi:hypothetical protein